MSRLKEKSPYKYVDLKYHPSGDNSSMI